MSSLSYTGAANMDPGYQSTPSDNRYYTSYGDARPFTTDDRARTPRYFSDSDNRKPPPDYPIYSHFPPDDYIYEHPFSSISDIYSSTYDDHISTPTTTYSIVVSDDTSISMPELASDRSDFSNPTSPVDSGSPRMPVPSVPSTSPQPQTAYSSNFRNRTDAGYSTPRISIPDPDPSLWSGSSSDNARLQTDSRRHPVFHQTRSGNVPTAIVTPSGEVPYAESVLSIESEDEVHKIAKMNAEYNAATSAMYGTPGRGSLPGPSLVASMSRMAAPIAVPRDPTARQIFTDAPLTSSPTQIRYADELQRSTSYRGDRPSDGRPVYNSAPYRPAVPPARHADDFLPPLREWDDSRISSTPWNSPEISYELYNPTSRSRRASDRETENPHSRPLPIPPHQARMYGTSEGAPVAEKVLIVQRSPEMPSKQPLPDDRKGQQRNDVPEQPAPSQVKQSSSSRRERRGSVSVQAELATSTRSSVGIASVVAVQYSSDEYESGEVTRSSSTRKSKDRRRAAAPDDAQRVPENTSSTSPPHEPRFIPKVETPSVPAPDRSQPRYNSTSTPTLAPVEENRTSGNRPGRSSREGVESGDREGSSRTKKSSSSYDRADKSNGTSSSPREERSSEKSKSSRHGQDRAPKEQSSRSSVPTPGSTEKPSEYERRRKDSTAQPPPPSEIPPTEKPRRRRDSTTQPPPPSEIPIISPTLVPLARPSAPQTDQMSRSYSRGGPPIVTVETQGIYQRPSRRYSDDDRSLSSNGSYSGRRDPTTPTSATVNQSYSSYTAPEPQRRYSDGDVPPQPPFFQTDAVTRQPSMGGGRRTMPNPRTVRWDDNLICPSPVLASQRREGWFNRRGYVCAGNNGCCSQLMLARFRRDQLWTNDGLYRPAPAGQEYPQDLDDYPEYGEGWMNEKCVRIDMGHRLIPKTPLRPALKQTQQR